MYNEKHAQNTEQGRNPNAFLSRLMPLLFVFGFIGIGVELFSISADKDKQRKETLMRAWVSDFQKKAANSFEFSQYNLGSLKCKMLSLPYKFTKSGSEPTPAIVQCSVEKKDGGLVDFSESFMKSISTVTRPGDDVSVDVVNFDNNLVPVVNFSNKTLLRPQTNSVVQQQE